MCAELGLLIDAVQARNIGGWVYVGIVPLGGKEPPRLPGWLVPVTFKLVPALRRESVTRWRPCAPTWQEHSCGGGHARRPDLVARIRTLRERQLPTLSIPTSMHTWPMS